MWKVMTGAMGLGAAGGASLALAQAMLFAPQPAAADQTPIAMENVADAATGPCDAVAFKIYFEPGSASINSEAVRLLDIVARATQSCGDTQVSLAAWSAQDAAASLNSARILAVAEALEVRGLADGIASAAVSAPNSPQSPSPDYVEVRLRTEAGAGTDMASVTPFPAGANPL